jgi:hypothetical protein
MASHDNQVCLLCRCDIDDALGWSANSDHWLHCDASLIALGLDRIYCLLPGCLQPGFDILSLYTQLADCTGNRGFIHDVERYDLGTQSLSQLDSLCLGQLRFL